MTKPLSAALFKGLSPHEIEVVCTAASKRTLEPAQIISRAQEPAGHLILLMDGCADYFVDTSDGREILLRRLIPGNALGYSTFLTEPNGFLGTAKAVVKTETLMWEHRVVRQLAAAYPRLVENALRASLHHIALYAQRHVRLISATAKQRVGCALASLGARAGHTHAGGVEVDIRNEDLASLADVNFFTVSRILGAWARQGVIAKSRGKVLIRCPEKMLTS